MSESMRPWAVNLDATKNKSILELYRDDIRAHAKFVEAVYCGPVETHGHVRHAWLENGEGSTCSGGQEANGECHKA